MMMKLQIENNFFNLSFYPVFESYYSNNGRYVEPETRSWFLNNLNEQDIIFDVGAHIGLYSILFSQKTPYVYSFEPTDTYENYLIENLKSNNIDSVKTEKVAFGNKIGNLQEKIYKIWGQAPSEEYFDFTTLDHYTSVNEIIPNYIKIDADGYDYEILLGGKNLLQNNTTIVCVEINHALETRGYNSNHIFDFMNSIGYTNFQVLDNENFFFKKIDG